MVLRQEIGNAIEAAKTFGQLSQSLVAEIKHANTLEATDLPL